MKKVSLICLSLLFCGALQASSNAAVTKGSWVGNYFMGPVGPTGPNGPAGPQGEKGSRGPKGPSGEKGTAFTSAYGYALLGFDTDQAAPIQDRVSFSQPANGALSNVTWNDTDKQFQIQKPGLYEVSYFAHCLTDMTNENSTALQISILYGTTSPSSTSFVSLFHPAIQLPSTGDCETHGTALLRLNAGDFVALGLQKTNPNYLLPIYWQSKGIAASLSLKRIAD